MKFWQDKWCRVSSLAVCYPKLLRISRENEAIVADLMKVTNGILHWDVHFMRAIQD